MTRTISGDKTVVVFVGTEGIWNIEVAFTLGEDGQWTAEPVKEAAPDDLTGKTSPPYYILDDLFASGDPSLTLYISDTLELKDGRAYNTFSLADPIPAPEPGMSEEEWEEHFKDYYYRPFKQNFFEFQWTEREAPPKAVSYYDWLTLTSADGTKCLTFWDTIPSTVEYTDGTTTRYWNVTEENINQPLFTDAIRREIYDQIEYMPTNIVFPCDGSAEEAADLFVHSVYEAHLRALAPINSFGVEEFEILEWAVTEVSDDGHTVTGTFRDAFTPTRHSTPSILGNPETIPGDIEDMYVNTFDFTLEQREDGYWHCASLHARFQKAEE